MISSYSNISSDGMCFNCKIVRICHPDIFCFELKLKWVCYIGLILESKILHFRKSTLVWLFLMIEISEYMRSFPIYEIIDLCIES